MVTRMEACVNLVEEVISTMQGEIGSLREQVQKIPHIEHTMARILNHLDQIVQF